MSSVSARMMELLRAKKTVWWFFLLRTNAPFVAFSMWMGMAVLRCGRKSKRARCLSHHLRGCIQLVHRGYEGSTSGAAVRPEPAPTPGPA